MSELSGHSINDILSSKEKAGSAFRAGAQATHPDHGGKAADFIRLKAASERLKRHFN